MKTVKIAHAMVNVFDGEFEYDAEDPDGYRAGQRRVGADAGGTQLTVRLYEAPPGQSICPYHYEYCEEWALVLAGSPTLRAPDGERPLAAGELVCFPIGPDGAHKLTNRGTETARVLMWSVASAVEVAVYPDSDKIGVWTGNDDDAFMLRRADGGRGYYDGER